MTRFDWSDFILAAAMTICCLMASCHTHGTRLIVGVYDGGIDMERSDRESDVQGVFVGLSLPLTDETPNKIVNNAPAFAPPHATSTPPRPSPGDGEPAASLDGSVEEPASAPGGAADHATGGGCAKVGEDGRASLLPPCEATNREVNRLLLWLPWLLATGLAAWKWWKPIMGFLKGFLEVKP